MVRIQPTVDGGVNFLNHLGERDHFLAGEMPAALGKYLVFDLDGVGPAALEHAHRAGHIDGVAETGIGIDDQRQTDRIAHRGDMVGKLAQGDQAQIRHTQKHVGDPGAGHVDRLEADILDKPRGERIGRAGQDYGPALRHHILDPTVEGGCRGHAAASFSPATATAMFRRAWAM